ncbi:hypothetical protein AYI69_g8290 [Smittium culicis]|uniref:Uncharacterized protein n=1 Tax=Smittium culicis TaxID=133412 RepID=A0A1R1XKM3_9FUNG|nr:hypothetical protein AYI69_g8290 [Smittium culicis]
MPFKNFAVSSLKFRPAGVGHALGSPVAAHSHSTDVLEAQPQCGMHCAQVCVLVSGADGLPLRRQFGLLIAVDSHDRTLGGIHSHFPDIRPHSDGIQ